MNLYKSNYLECSEKLLKLANDIKNKNTDKNGFINSSYYFEIPKEVRHYNSMFPNNFLDVVDFADENKKHLMKEINEKFDILINDDTKKESDLKRFIKENEAYYIIGSILRRNYNFGHHGAYLFPEFQLGNEYKCDYLIVGDSSDGFKFLFVEMEDINSSPQLKEGYFSESLRKGINQIKDWQIWLEKNFNALDFRRYKSPIVEIPEEFTKYISTRMNYVIVCGRRKDYSSKLRDICRKEEKDSNILILNHDNLLDSAKEMVGGGFISY